MTILKNEDNKLMFLSGMAVVVWDGKMNKI